MDGLGACRHSCADHSEVMDPCLWSRLPEHLLAHVLARLSMLSLGLLSKAWLATSKTSGFKRICAGTPSPFLLSTIQCLITLSDVNLHITPVSRRLENTLVSEFTCAKHVDSFKYIRTEETLSCSRDVQDVR